MNKYSQWYYMFGEYSFPTLFIYLTQEEKTVFKGDQEHYTSVENKISQALLNHAGKSFISCDNCSPLDAKKFIKRKAITSGKQGLDLLLDSQRVCQSINNGNIDYLILRPYRRIDKTREFRLFIKNKKLVGISQYCLERHFARLVGRKENILNKTTAFIDNISSRFSSENLVIDIYITSQNSIMIVDFNAWKDKTSPLLFASWDYFDKEIEKAELRLMNPPTKIQGNVEVSF